MLLFLDWTLPGQWDRDDSVLKLPLPGTFNSKCGGDGCWYVLSGVEGMLLWRSKGEGSRQKTAKDFWLWSEYHISERKGRRKPNWAERESQCTSNNSAKPKASTGVKVLDPVYHSELSNRLGADAWDEHDLNFKSEADPKRYYS